MLWQQVIPNSYAFEIYGRIFRYSFCAELTNETLFALFRQPNETLRDQIAVIELTKETNR